MKTLFFHIISWVTLHLAMPSLFALFLMMFIVAPTIPIYGYPGAALNFDGVDDNVSSSYAIPNTGASFTIEAWFLMSPTFGGTGGLFYQSGAGGNNTTFNIEGGNSLVVSLKNGGSTVNFTANTPTAISLGWHHVAFVYDAPNWKTYYDGVLLATLNDAASLRSGTLYFGGNLHTGSYFSGAMDEIRVWSTARTATEIYDNMWAPLNAPLPATLETYLKFEKAGVIPDGGNGANTTANDHSGNGTNGTLNNFALTGQTSNYVNSRAFTLNSNSLYCSARTDGIKVERAGSIRCFDFWYYPTVDIVNTDKYYIIDFYNAAVNSIGDIYQAQDKRILSHFGEFSIYVNGVLDQPFVLNSWNHVYVERNANLGSIATIYIGASDLPGFTTDGFIGYIDELKFWSTAVGNSNAKNMRFNDYNSTNTTNLTNGLSFADLAPFTWSDLAYYFKFDNDKYYDVSDRSTVITKLATPELSDNIAYSHWLPDAINTSWTTSTNWSATRVPSATSPQYVVLDKSKYSPATNIPQIAASTEIMNAVILENGSKFNVTAGQKLTVSGKILKGSFTERVTTTSSGGKMSIGKSIAVW